MGLVYLGNCNLMLSLKDKHMISLKVNIGGRPYCVSVGVCEEGRGRGASYFYILSLPAFNIWCGYLNSFPALCFTSMSTVHV
jgi:hypothetical protein